MKKTGAILLAALLLLLIGSALAETNTVARNGALAAYLDGNGQLFLPGKEQKINRTDADALVSIDPYRVLFLATRDDGSNDLYMIDLGSLRERLVSEGVSTAIMADENTLYYVPSADRTLLKRMDMGTMTAADAFRAAEPIDRMYVSAEGLVFEQVDGTGTMIYNKLTGGFDSYLGTLPVSGAMTDRFELYLTDGDLYIRDLVSLVSEHIDTGVRAYAEMDGKVYYLSNTGSATRLKCYDPDAMTWQVALTLDPTMERQLTASDSQLFTLDSDGQVYTVGLENGELVPFRKVPDISANDIPAGYAVSRLKLEAMDGQLNVYAELEDASAEAAFSFIEFTSTSDAALPKVKLLERYAIDGEDAAWSYLKPAAQYSPLARGSRGEAVRAIQRPLYDLGYYDYYVDGIFGPRTQYAVKLLQSDLNRPVTGVADPELQRIILEGNLPAYDAYLALTRGNRGLRVQIMQEKLRDLGYLADAADGIFGANTQRAVQLFQSENGLSVSDGATRETLKRLYSGNALRCVSFIDLYPGYTGCRVRELNDRLQELYYLEYNPGANYTGTTTDAVRAFQRQAGLPVNGNATVNVLRRLFSHYAPEAPGYITLRRGDENDRVAALQRRLKELNYYDGAIDGYFGRETEKAVKLFQKKVGLNVTGVATVRTQRLLFAKDAPEYVKPTVIGVPVITVEKYDVVQNDIYYIDDDSVSGGYATFSWYAEGEVENFRVEVKDADGKVLVNEKTLLTRTGVSLATLDYDRVYTLTITAYPEDGNKKHITADSVRFVHTLSQSVPDVPPVGQVSDPDIAIESVLRSQGGVHYVKPGEVVLHWHADGEVDRYFVEVLNGSSDVILSLETSEEQAKLKSSVMQLGEVYTLYVYVIPTNGTLEDAASSAVQFALEDISVPTPTPEPEEPDITPEPIVTLEPTATPETTPEPDPTVTPEPEPEITNTPEPTETPEPEVIETTEPEVTETPEPEATAEPEATGTPEPEQEGQTEEEGPVITLPPEVEAQAVSEPTLSFETVIESSDGIEWLADDTVVLGWASEGDISDYFVQVVDDEGRVMAETTTDKTSLAVKKGNLQDGVVYTLIVTAIPRDGEQKDGATNAAQFALYREAVQETEPEVVAPEPEIVAPEPQGEEPEIVAPEYEEEPEYVEEHEPEYVEEPESEYVEEPESEYVEEPEPEYVEEPEPEYVEEAEPEYVEEPESEYVEEPEPEYVEEPESEYVEEAEPEYVEEPEPEYVEEPEPEYVEEPEQEYDDGMSAPDAATIGMLQNRLVSWGWLEADSFETGVLDDATLSAIARFEGFYNDSFGGELASFDGEVDDQTLSLLLNEDGETYMNEG